MNHLHRRFFVFLGLILIAGFGNIYVFAQDEKKQIAVNQNTQTETAETEKVEKTIHAPETLTSESEKTDILKNADFSRVGIDSAQTNSLSLNEAIRKALVNNNDIEIARDDVKFQETQLRSLLGNYDPVFSVTPVLSRSSTTGSGGSNDLRLDSSFSQFIRPGGGSYNVFLNTSQTGSNSRNNSVFNQTAGLSSTGSTTFFSTFGFTYNQPLLRDFKIDNNRRQIKIQKKRLQQTDADFRRRTIEIIAQVQRAYWDLVFALRDQQNRLANLNLSRENLRQVEARIEAGSAAPLERAEVSTELANRESDVLLAAQQVSTAENTLKQLLLKDPTAPEWTQSFVPTDRPVFSLEPINLDDALKDALENRAELRRLRLQNEINEIDIEFFRNQTKPQIDLNTTFSLNGLSLTGQTVPEGTATPLIFDPTNQTFVNLNADTFLLNRLNQTRQQLGLAPITDIPIVPVQGLPDFLDGGTFRSFGNLFRTDSPNYSVGVTFSFPLGNRTAKANLAGAQIQNQQVDAQTRQQEQIVVAEVRNAVQAVETARQRVLAARRARENAEIQLAGERKLYEVGRSTTFLLFQRENTLANARNAEIRAETDYNKALSDLQRATSTTFLVNNIQVDSPVDDGEIEDNK